MSETTKTPRKNTRKTADKATEAPKRITPANREPLAPSFEDGHVVRMKAD